MAGVTVATASDTKSLLQDMNKTHEGYNTWRQLYGTVDLAKQRDISNLTYDYEKNIGSAYADAFAAKQAVDNSTYFDAYKEQFNKGIDETLTRAYESYLQNYVEGVNKIDSSTASDRQQITNILNSQAQNTADLYNSAYDYLTAIASDREALASKVNLESPEWSRFYTADDETGKTRLKTWDELSRGDKSTAGFFETDPATGDKILSAAGQDFFRFVMDNQYYTDEYGIQSYDQWLAENNAELYDWYANQNVFDSAANKYGTTTNKSSFRKMLGLSPADEQYKKDVKAITGGKISQQVDSLIAQTDKLSKIATRRLSTHTKHIIENIDKVLTNYELLNDVTSILEQQGTSLDKLKEDIRLADPHYNIGKRDLNISTTDALKNAKRAVTTITEAMENAISNI